jgi:stearoyl-CoA desaturase (delta-9 desaturase)
VINRQTADQVLDLEPVRKQNAKPSNEKIDLASCYALVSVHLLALSAFFVSFSWFALSLCIALYVIRAWFITAGYHRYFAHKTYKTSRPFQFLLAFFGATAGQRGALWWASHHRRHHRYTDQPEDVHSPVQRGFFWSHLGWLLCKKFTYADPSVIQDFSKYPELRFLDKYHMLPFFMYAVALFGLGELLANYAPGLRATGPQLLVWGAFVSTVILYHATFMVNSVTHIWGAQPFKTKDESRNNWLVAILALGEGWHNNHHRFPYSEKQGFLYWWQIDVTHIALKGLEKMGLIWDIKTAPDYILDEARSKK